MIYTHKVQYYETDKQGITHHSNYIRIMEEARVHALEQIGSSYQNMEQDGIYSPVIAVSCEYKSPTTFADIIQVDITVAELTPLKARFAYTMTCRGKVVCRATSLHCFLNSAGRPIVISERFPQFYAALESMKQPQE